MGLQVGDHGRGPERLQVPGDAVGRALRREGGVIASDLLAHPDERLNRHGYRLTVASASWTVWPAAA